MGSLREDLILIAKLPEDTFNSIIDTVNSDNSKQIQWSVFIERVDEDFKDSSQALFRLINSLGEAFSNARKFDKEAADLDETVTKLANDDENALAGWNRVKNSYKSLTSFFISKKEENIKSRFSSVTETSITIDARPIFSLDKNKVEKMLYPFILKIETSDDKTFLCELYDEQLDSLEDEIKMVKAKRDALKKMVLGGDV